VKIFGNRTEKAESTPTRRRGPGVPGLEKSTPPGSEEAAACSTPPKPPSSGIREKC